MIVIPTYFNYIKMAKKHNPDYELSEEFSQRQLMDNFFDPKNITASFDFDIQGFGFNLNEKKNFDNIPPLYQLLNNININNFEGLLTFNNNNMQGQTSFYSNLFNLNSNILIDFKDVENPWIDDGIINISNMSSPTAEFIQLIEDDLKVNFPRNNINNIQLQLTGYLKTPRIKGMEEIKW